MFNHFLKAVVSQSRDLVENFRNIAELSVLPKLFGQIVTQ